jgi:hypothetical protein
LSRNVKVKIYKTIILLVVLYGCETCSHIKGRLRVFDNRVLRRILEPKRGEVTGEWRKLHSEELHILYSSPNVIRQLKLRRMRCAEHVACRMRNEKCVQGFDGIRMNLRDIGGECRWDPVGSG